jgi:hypothetical protein
MYKNLATFLSGFVNPITDGLELRLKRINAIITHSLDVHDLDTTFALFDPQRAVTA